MAFIHLHIGGVKRFVYSTVQYREEQLQEHTGKDKSTVQN